MPKRRDLNGLPHDLTKSFFSTLRYDNGYMADWILNGARSLQLNTITLDLLNTVIDPSEMEKPPLLYHLADLKNMLEKNLMQNGFPSGFIIYARIKVEIPRKDMYARTLYCYPEIRDKDGRVYKCRRIIEQAYEMKHNPYDRVPFFPSLLRKIKRLFK